MLSATIQSDHTCSRGGGGAGDALHGHVAGNRVALSVCFWFVSAVVLPLALGCTREVREERINSIIRCKSEAVQQIVLLPASDSRATLVAAPVTIEDRMTIDAICGALNASSRLWPRNPAIIWCVKVEMRTGEQDIAFVVMHTEQEKNGTFIAVDSHVTSGWNYGRFRSDLLGPILEAAAGAANNAENRINERKDLGFPVTAYAILAAICFALLALVHLRYTSKVRQVFDSLAAIFGTSKYMADYREPYYRMVGGIYAACAVAMGLAAVLSLVFR